ncbi:Paraquat-inducible protein A, partial [Pseudomonas coronafaciens pv. coronafaciens]
MFSCFAPSPFTSAPMASMSTVHPTEHSTGLIICEHCDSLYEAQPLKPGEAAFCLRCEALLGRGRRMTIEQLLALTLAAAMFFVFANFFPVISISMKGLTNEVTLWQSVEALAQGRITLIALVAGLSIIFAPLLQIVLL